MKLKRMGLWLTLAALPVVVGGVLASHQYVPVAALEGAGTTDSPYLISNYADFKAYFDGGAANTGNHAKLTADIDLEGNPIPAGMAGEYTATFDGAGFKIYNATFSNNTSLFNIVKGKIQNLTLELFYEGADMGAWIRPFVSTLSAGTLTNNTVAIKSASKISSLAPHAWLGSNGKMSGLSTHYFIGNDGSTELRPIYDSQHTDPVMDSENPCTYTVTTYNSITPNASVINNVGNITDASSGEVSYIYPDAYSLETGVDSSVEFTYLLAGTPTGDPTVTTGDSSIATASVQDGKVMVTGVGEGETTVTVTYGQGDSAVSRTVPVTIQSGSAVTAIEITGVPESMETGTTAELTANLTGFGRDHIKWTSSDDSVISVEGNESTATITALKAGSATITATAYADAAEGQVLASKETASINVTEAVTFRVHLLAPYEKTSYALGLNGWGDVAYAKIGSNYNPLPRQVGENNSPIVLVINSDRYYVYSGDVSVSDNNWTGNGGIEVNNTTVGAWGGPVTVNNGNSDGTYGDVILMSPWDNGTQSSGETFSASLVTTWTPTELEAGLDYAATTAYGTTSWRDETGSVCGILNDSTRLTTVLNGYDALDDGTKAVVDCVYDTTDVTLGQTIAYLKSVSTNSDNGWVSNEASAMAKRQEFNATTIWLLTLLGLIPVVGVSATLIIKRRRESK